MMIEELEHLLQAGRGTRLEWLSDTASVESIATNLTAMANSAGGALILGIVTPNATVMGVRDANSAIDRVLQAALSIEPPLIIPMPRALKYKGRVVVMVQVARGMPHVYALDGRFVQREDTEILPLKPRDVRRLMIERGEASFETEIAQGAAREDLDWNKVKSYVAGLGSINEQNAEQVLIKRACLVEYDGQLRPTNAGILLFGNDPQRYIRGLEITAVRFAGAGMSDTFIRQDITGTLPDQIRRAETFLVDHLRKNMQLGKSMARDEQFEYPLEAARELVVNAVAHRDYSIGGDGIRLFIFSNRMEITSPGSLPGPVTINNIKDERFSRNPVIVQILSDMGFIERLGYGVDRVIDLMRSQQLQAPEFHETGGGFRVTLYSQLETSADDVIDVPQPAPTEPVAKPAIKFNGIFRGIPINPRQETALVYLHTDDKNRITNSDLQNLCPEVHPETIRRDLVDLVTKNILRKMGQKRGSYYVLNNEQPDE